MQRFQLLLSCLFLVNNMSILMAQRETDNWFFGQNCALQFGSGSPTPVSGSAMNAWEGSASVSDKTTGALLFYTRGTTVYDASHNPMPNGTGLMGGSSSTQGALIVPMPGSNNLYYLFTADSYLTSSGTAYSIIDMNLNGGLGDVTGVKNVMLHTPSSEQLSAVKHSNCKDWWIMSKEIQNNTYHAYLLTETGLSAPVTSTVGLPFPDLGVGQSKFAPDGSRYAVAICDAMDMIGFVQLFDFDNTTGMLSNPQTLFFSNTILPYGLSFSGDNSKLYTHEGTSGVYNTYQYDLSSNVLGTIIASKTLIGSTNMWGQLQLGPDHRLYVSANSGSSSLSVIPNPNALGTLCGWAPLSVPVSGVTTPGLCNFPESYFNEVNPCTNDLQATLYSDSPNCFGDLVNVWCTVNQGTPPYNFLWSPTGSSNDTLFTVNAGTYILTVTDALDSVFTDTLVIAEPPLLQADILNLPDTVCAQETVTLLSAVNGGTLPYSYSWTGASGLNAPVANITVTTSTLISLTVTDSNGCEAADTFQIVVQPTPEAYFEMTPEILDFYESHEVTFENLSANAQHFVWNFGESGTSVALNPSFTFPVSDANFYQVCLTASNNHGCASIYCQELKIMPTSSIYVPNAFTPDGNGVNDVFLPVVHGEFSGGYLFTVYNRYGEPVFVSANSFLPWDGTYQGISCPVGIYTWTLLMDSQASGIPESFTGSVILIR